MYPRVISPLLGFALLLGVAACTNQPSPGPATAPGGAKSTDIQINDPGLAGKAASPVAASPQAAASPRAATSAASPVAAARGGPSQGKLTYVWHTAISPAWFDPSENPQQITQYGWQYMLHDAVIKHLPNQPFAPSLAESYEIAPDNRSATIKLRPNLKFHNGDPLTSADVKFTFENYRGTGAQLLKSKTERIETPDDRTVIFRFKEPFLDFLMLYGSPATGAGWILPAKYYQQVGPDGFKRNPVGAGPYKLIRQSAGSEAEFEAFEDYWRKVPNIKTILVKGIAEDSTRVATIMTGEADFINLVPGALVDTVRSNPQVQLASSFGAAVWLEPIGQNDPNNPFHNPKVRQAISLALDRKSISQAEEAGLSRLGGNWIPEDWPGAIARPSPEFNLEKAKQLLTEAGFPNGFDGGQITPLPPYFSLAERVSTQLREVGIRTSLNQMERGAFLAKLAEGPTAFPAPGLLLNVSGSPGDAATRIRAFAMCQGANARMCYQQGIDDKMTKFDTSADPKEREQLIKEVQEYILDNNIMVPIYRQAFINAQGPRIANKWEEIVGVIPQYAYIGPYEDIQLKPGS